MQIPILIEPVAGNGFRAETGAPLDLCAEGSTRDEVLTQMRSMIRQRVESGAEVVAMTLEPTQHPLLPFAGIFKGDPLVSDWKEAMEERRREDDAKSDAP